MLSAGAWLSSKLLRLELLCGLFSFPGRAPTANTKKSWPRNVKRPSQEASPLSPSGNLFLEDVRSYREKRLEGSGLQPLFPIWGSPTRALAQEMISWGMRAKLTCIDTRKLDSSFAGRDFDQRLLTELPEGIDPCGENGEFHSFVYAGPIFSNPLSVSSGEIVLRDGFAFADVIPLHG